MSREPRSIRAGAVYHLISRVVASEFLITTSLQRSLYLDLQWRALKRVDWRLIGFALMSNHLHLVAIAGVAPLADWLRPVHSEFADLVNRDHGRIGPVLVRGPKAYPVDTGRVAHLLAYVHNNPVRAEVAETARESTWTSHRAYVGAADVPLCLDIGVGQRIHDMSAEGFDEWVNDPAQRAERSFSERAHELDLQRLAGEPDEVIPRTEHHRVAHVVVEQTASVLGVSAAVMRGATRGRPEVLARVVAVRSAAMLGLSEVSIARALDVSQQRVSIVRRKDAPSEVSALAAAVTQAVRDHGSAG